MYEVLHVVHILDQLCKGFLFNTTSEHGRTPVPWTMFDTNERESCVLAWAYRLKFQPGAPTKHYHGTGMPHVHIVFRCTANVMRSGLLRWLRADLAQEFPRLHAAMLRIQSLQKPEPTGLPFAESSTWQGSLPVLKHNEEDEAAGMLLFLTPLCYSQICHSNVSCFLHTWAKCEKNNKSGTPRHKKKTSHRCSTFCLLAHMSCYRKDVPVPAPDEHGSTATVQAFQHYLVDDFSHSLSFETYLRYFNAAVGPPRRYRKFRGNTTALAVETTVCGEGNCCCQRNASWYHHGANGELADSDANTPLGYQVLAHFLKPIPNRSCHLCGTTGAGTTAQI